MSELQPNALGFYLCQVFMYSLIDSRVKFFELIGHQGTSAFLINPLRPLPIDFILNDNTPLEFALINKL